MRDKTQQPARPPEGGRRGDNMKAMFGAGCFWGVETAFRKVEGVQDVTVGYAGGHTQNPTYDEACFGDTGHAEVVEIVYDPEQVSYEDLLEVFWSCHDPTQKDRQGPDIGDQYRSVVFYFTEEQQGAAHASKQQLASGGRFNKPIATQIEAAGTFYPAEEYHQRYLEKQGRAVCR